MRIADCVTLLLTQVFQVEDSNAMATSRLSRHFSNSSGGHSIVSKFFSIKNMMKLFLACVAVNALIAIVMFTTSEPNMDTVTHQNTRKWAKNVSKSVTSTNDVIKITQKPNDANPVANKNNICSVTMPETNVKIEDVYTLSQEDFINNYLLPSPVSNVSHCISTYEERVDYWHEWWWPRLWVFPKAKLLMQAVAKTGSSTLKLLSKELNMTQYPLDVPYPLEHPSDILTYLCSGTYKRIFFVRDPLARLLSGYLDKCTETTNEFNWAEWHISCGVYLNATARRFDMSIQTFIGSKQNTYFEFLNWIVLEKLENIDGHFRLFETEHMIKEDWSFLNIKDQNLWILFLKAAFSKSEFASEVVTNKRRQRFHLYCENERDVFSEHGAQASQSGADKKVLLHYTDVRVLDKALTYTLSNYIELEFTVPEWTCGLLNGSDTDTRKVVELLQKKLKKKQLPSCIN